MEHDGRRSKRTVTGSFTGCRQSFYRNVQHKYSTPLLMLLSPVSGAMSVMTYSSKEQQQGSHTPLLQSVL